jgi:hypothetical protein
MRFSCLVKPCEETICRPRRYCPLFYRLRADCIAFYALGPMLFCFIQATSVKSYPISSCVTHMNAESLSAALSSLALQTSATTALAKTPCFPALLLFFDVLLLDDPCYVWLFETSCCPFRDRIHQT